MFCDIVPLWICEIDNNQKNIANFMRCSNITIGSQGQNKN